MKTYFLVCLLLISSYLSAFSEIPPEMEKEVALLQAFPKSKELLQTVEKEGVITLKWREIPKGFNAFWSGQKRIIALNASHQWAPGEKLYSLLFELNNAYTSTHFAALDYKARRHEIGKETYVFEVEKTEYENVMKTNALFREGMRLGYFPKGLSVPLYPSFSDHLALQEQSGHSAAIRQKYHLLASAG